MTAQFSRLGAVIFVCRNKSMKVKLGDVCERGTSNLRQSDVVGKGGDYPIYGASGYIGDVDFYHQEKSYVAIVKDGAGIGRTMLCPEKSSVIGTMQYLLPKDAILPQYLYYVVKYMHLEKYFSGATIPHIYFKDYKNEQFNLDTLKKQAIIVKILGKCEEVIAARNKQLNALDELIQARFVELFGNESNPKAWEIVNVESVADVQVGVVIKPSQYYTDAIDGIKAFRSLNVGEGFIKDENWVYFTKEGHKKNAKSVLKENDLLIVRSGAPGTACVVTKEYEGCNAIDIIIAHPNCEKVNPYYLCAYTNMPHGKKQINEGTGGAAQQHFNVTKYNKLQLMLPPMKLQDEFVTFVNQVNKSKVEIQQALEKTQLLFDSLMQQYFG